MNHPRSTPPTPPVDPLAIAGPPPRVSPTRSTPLQDLEQGLEYLRFIWRISTRIHSWRSRLRFVVGLILWRPFLPKDGLD
ncbi:MAG TPA: hypothetical protein V6D06_02155 [Trichocoleus sp.]